MAALSDDDYCLWLLDTSRDAFRIFLVEADHSAGTIYLASRPWVSDANMAYDDWLVGSPYVEGSIDSFAGLGDFEAVNLDTTDVWENHTWNGQECRWYFGDMSWLKQDFRRTGVTLVEECVPLGQKLYRFNLQDNGFKLQRALVTTDTTRTESIEDALEWISDQTGVSIEATGVTDTRLAWEVSYLMTPTTKAGDVVKKIAAGVNAKFRVDQFGNVSLVVPQTSNFTLVEDDILSDRIAAQSVERPFVTVTVIKDDDTRRSEDTEADTGSVLSEIEIPTYLTLTANADEILAEYVEHYVNQHTVWTFDVSEVCDVLTLAQTITVEHTDLSATGYISSIRRSSLSADTQIELVT